MQIIFPEGLDSYLQTKQNIFSVTKFKREIKIHQEKTYVQVIIAQWLARGGLLPVGHRFKSQQGREFINL